MFGEKMFGENMGYTASYHYVSFFLGVEFFGQKI